MRLKPIFRSSDSFLLATLLLVGVLGLVYGLTSMYGEDPPCTDYSFKISRMPFNSKVAICDQWSGMDMRIDMSMLGGTMVNCYCPEVP